MEVASCGPGLHLPKAQWCWPGAFVCACWPLCAFVGETPSGALCCFVVGRFRADLQALAPRPLLVWPWVGVSALTQGASPSCLSSWALWAETGSHGIWSWPALDLVQGPCGAGWPWGWADLLGPDVSWPQLCARTGVQCVERPGRVCTDLSSNLCGVSTSWSP